ncbi:MAG: hypothetical protein PHG73_11000 [Pygmaiobacter sp.]|nr:hypothetical protein [Pygmaiobacter sp.]
MNWKDGVCIALALFFLFLLMQQLVYLQQLEVRTKKSRAEIVIIGVTLLVLAGLVWWSGAGLAQLAAGLFAVAFFVAGWQKQGLTAVGLLTFQRGREFYPWQKLGRVEMVQGQTVKLTFYTADGVALVTHDYWPADLPRVRSVLAAAGVQLQIKE